MTAPTTYRYDALECPCLTPRVRVQMHNQGWPGTFMPNGQVELRDQLEWDQVTPEMKGRFIETATRLSTETR